jgi:preprotein translocase subunit YajC
LTALFAIATPVLAQEADAPGSALSFLFPIIILGGLFYVFILMPQRRRRKNAKELQASIAVGDEIRTIGGIIGTIVAEDDSTFTIQIEGSRMRITKRAVAERVDGGPE